MVDNPLHPPTLRSEPRIKVLHGDITIDCYGWLRDRENPEVLAYLNAENAYAEQATEHLESLKTELVAEIEARQPRGGVRPSFQVGSFEYFQRPERDLPHATWWRKEVSGGSEELVLDPNTLPGAEIFYSLGVFEPSDDGRYVAFSFDIVGNERYELRVRSITDGRDICRHVGPAGSVVWAADGRTLFFALERTDRRQFDRIIRLDVVNGASEVVFEEVNERLSLLVRRSDSGVWLFIDVITTADMSCRVQRGAAEVWCLPAQEPAADWRRIADRERGHEIYAEHWGDSFLFRVNDAGPYWRLVRAPIDDPSPSHWTELVAHRADVTLEEIHVLEQHLVLLERDGLHPRLVSHDESGRVEVTIVTDEPSCTVGVGLSAGGRYSVARHPFRSSKLTYSVSSFLVPDIFVDHDLAKDQAAILHETRISGFDAAQYEATVVMAEADDGVQVPVSLVARRDRASPGPVLLTVYGCYGAPLWPSFFGWPSFMMAHLSLLDRGFSFGIVHARGGGELGRPWHEAAIRERKRVTYTDLIAAAEALIDRGIATRDGVVIEGMSAGGGTVLATAGLRPDLFRAVLAEVPVADIIDTEMDFTLPYALRETAEYGDPHNAQDYRYLRTYDPYYNLDTQRPCPPTYVDAALDDGQVLYHQPARYVAQRRSTAADRDPRLLFRTRMVGGHSGASHGPSIAEQAAFRIAWILDQFNHSSN
ncbi:prolyl oligopeptidase family serine peptidase [Rhizobium etli]|uniref:prolyl oligopeptidase family serine peptidase n=1 Tax=Rhizobium etli TaxID=29449 RepID=UPI0003839E9C|nr:prolyl oligopeptidase family serine peptidase [Rhizobium etli]AGS24505.1 prolyl oligopeptidase domain-containing protein [Rhizobium etli bv. mimosae str. Mim1]